jgi:hypothetical protein
MKRAVAHKLVPVLLSLNAILLAALLLVLLRGVDPTSSAMAQIQPPLNGSGMDLVVVPGQISANTWGCYVADKQAGSLCIYQYIAGERLLRLIAARSISQDFGLKNFNTEPSPAQVAELVARERMGPAGAATRAVPPVQQTDGK